MSLQHFHECATQGNTQTVAGLMLATKARMVAKRAKLAGPSANAIAERSRQVQIRQLDNERAALDRAMKKLTSN